MAFISYKPMFRNRKSVLTSNELKWIKFNEKENVSFVPKEVDEKTLINLCSFCFLHQLQLGH